MPDSNITKNALANTLKDLMTKQPFSKISVGDICEACGMNRKSFYYHFKDKYDLVNWIFDTEFIMIASSANYTSIWQLLDAICHYFYKEQLFYRYALQITGQNSFQDYFRQKIQPIIHALTKDLFVDFENPQFYITFFSDAFIAAILRWLSDGTKQIPPEKFMEQLKEIMLVFSKKALIDLTDEDINRTV